MLRGIHKATSTWVGKAIMGVIMGGLIVSFAIWGIGDIFRGFGANSVAKIGGTEITVEQFRQFYTDRLQQLGRQFGRPVTQQEARARGLDRQLLGQLVAETTLDEQAQAMRLGLSDTEIAQRITGDPNFKSLTGQFDRARFEQMIRQAGYTEGRFVAEQRRVMLRRQIAQSVSGELRVPQVALKVVNQYQNEKRAIDFVTLGPAQAGEIAAPTPEELAKYFDERKTLFRAPEYRKVTLLPLAPAEIAKPDAVTDAEAKAYFDQRKDSYGSPEKREVRQMVFPNAEEAAAARDRLVKGLSFSDLAKERGLSAGDTELGLVTKTAIIDPAVADAAFALKPGDTSEPIKGRFGIVLLQIGKTEPGNQKTYEDVAAQIKREIAEARAKNDINGLRDKIEDERAGGATLAETAKKLSLKSVTIEAVDRSGRGPDGKPVAELPRTPDVVGTAFSSDIGVDTDPLQLPGGGYIYFDVTGITPSRDRTLDEVKDQAAARWRDDEIAKRLQAKSDDLLGKLKAGAPLAQVASEAGLTVQPAWDLQRGKPGTNLPAKVVDVVFRTAKDAVAAAEGDKATERFIFRVTGVTDPPLDANSQQAKSLTGVLQNSYADDVVGQYLARLEADFGVTLNQQALNQVIGGSSSSQ